MAVSNVDFDKPDQVTESAKAIFDRANKAGMFSSDQPASRIFYEIRISARQWLHEIERRINRFTPSQAFDIIGYYEMIHQIGYSRMATPHTINKYVLKAFEAHIRGDQTIDQYELFSYISSGIKRTDPTYLDRPLRWYSTCLDRWHKQFRYGASSEKLDDYDTIQRVCALLDNDLRAFETTNELSYKQLLFETHKHYLDNLKTNDSTSDPKTAKAIEHFLYLSRPYLSAPEYYTFRNLLIKPRA